MLNTVSAKQIQRGYKKIFEQANKDNTPILVITNNKPVGAIISLDLLDKLNKNIQLEMLEEEALKEYFEEESFNKSLSEEGETKTISTPEELKKFFSEIRKAVE